MSNENQSCQGVGRATLSTRQLSKVLGVSLRHVKRLHSDGLLPQPVRLGRSLKWIEAEIMAWLRLGAPDRDTWENTKEARV